jgi:hypothetical protein
MGIPIRDMEPFIKGTQVKEADQLFLLSRKSLEVPENVENRKHPKKFFCSIIAYVSYAQFNDVFYSKVIIYGFRNILKRNLGPLILAENVDIFNNFCSDRPFEIHPEHLLGKRKSLEIMKNLQQGIISGYVKKIGNFDQFVAFRKGGIIDNFSEIGLKQGIKKKFW